VSDQKIKKQGSGGMSLELVQVEDFMPQAHGRYLVKVAFAAETSNVETNAAAKAAPKGAAFVVANDVSEPGSGFGTDANRVTFVDAAGNSEALPLMAKLDVAHAILDRALPLLKAH
jgi:phosphopantothenoylcysteine decarboxylase/phosphopantothenate--cysteine ligase